MAIIEIILKEYLNETLWFTFVTITISLLIRKSFFSQNKDCEVNAEEKSQSEPKDILEEEYKNDEIYDDYQPALPEDLEHIPYEYTRCSNAEMIQKSSDFYQTMNARRSVRFFSSDTVPEEVIQNIVKTAGTAPSGAHTEPWRFVVVKDPNVKQQIREIVEEEEYLNYTRRMGKKWTTDIKPLKTTWQKQYLTDAPYLILLFKQLYSFDENGKKKIHYYHEISTAIAAGMLITAIHTAGLTTLTSTPLQCGGRLREILGRPNEERLTLLFPTGLPASSCTVPALARKPLHEICTEI